VEHSFLLTRHPSGHLHRVFGNYLATETDTKFRSQRLDPRCDHGLGHGLIENRADDPAMDNAVEPF